jgi:AcrR family transcriptional regulator
MIPLYHKEGRALMPKRVDHAQRRREIADALLRAARSDGLHATGVREVAAEAGVSVRLVQYYFDNKAKLLLGGLQRLGERIAERISEHAAALPPTSSSRDRVETVLGALLPADELTRDLYAVHAQYAALALTDPHLAAQPYADGASNLQAEITRMVREAQQAGEIRPGRHPEHASLALVALTTGLAAGIVADHHNLSAARIALQEHLDSLFTTKGAALTSAQASA